MEDRVKCEVFNSLRVGDSGYVTRSSAATVISKESPERQEKQRVPLPSCCLSLQKRDISVEYSKFHNISA